MGISHLKGQKKPAGTGIRDTIGGMMCRAWKQVIVPVLTGLSEESSTDDAYSLFLFYRLLALVVVYLESRKELTLVNMVDDLKRQKYIKPHCAHKAVIQLVFQISGWITTFWDPVLDTSNA
jgi:hypothetical protein